MPWEETMKNLTCASVIALAAFSAPQFGRAQQTSALGGVSETVTVRLSNFAFDPNHLRLRAGVPVRLRLVNESSGGHDFNAPEFFAASSILPGSLAPPNGDVTVGSHQTVEIAVVPRTLGTYKLNCTHFLHSFFGMHGTVEVIP
jgi:plastocyanin